MVKRHVRAFWRWDATLVYPCRYAKNMFINVDVIFPVILFPINAAANWEMSVPN